MAKNNTAPAKPATTLAKPAPAATTLAAPYTMPALPQGTPQVAAKGTAAAPGTLANAMGMGFTVPSTQQGANVALANTVWPQLGQGATVQVATHGAHGLVLHARTSTAAKPVCNAVPVGMGGGTKAALRVAVPPLVLAAMQAHGKGTVPTGPQAQALATWCAQLAPCCVPLPAAPGA